ncbi:MAG: hypothetical protein JSR83_24010 [Proteobacteria bacterium]|nr:hypothetical protein [Pseudomonadota bacterium]
MKKIEVDPLKNGENGAHGSIAPERGRHEEQEQRAKKKPARGVAGQKLGVIYRTTPGWR